MQLNGRFAIPEPTYAPATLKGWVDEALDLAEF
jgi:hypothetical protein